MPAAFWSQVSIYTIGDLVVRVCITGAGGFFGHHLLEHILVSTSWDVVATDSFRHRGKTDRIAQVLDGDPGLNDLSDVSARHRAEAAAWPGMPAWRDRVTVITHDLTAPFSSQAAARIAGPDGLDYLIAAASESHVDRSIADPVPFVLNNVAVILNTLELARRLKPRAAIVISTDEVYGPETGGVPHLEWSPVLPSNPYAGSKAAQEAVAISYWRTYGVPVVLVNVMNLIGERQDPEKYIPKVIRAVRAGKVVTIHGTAGDIGSRHYLHARNLADGVLFLLARPPAMFAAGDRAPDRWNIASPDRVDNLTLAQMIAGAAGYQLRYELADFHSARPGHDPHYGLDPGKITGAGWKAPVPFAESLERTVRWSLQNPEWLE